MHIDAFDRALLARDGVARLLLDVRNPVEAERWRPEGPGLTAYANIPYFEFIEDEDAATARVPRADRVLVLCAKGGSSEYVAQLLRARGIDASNIEGGMIDWAAYHRIGRLNPAGEPFELYQVVRPAKGCLSYVVVAGGQALVVDPSRYTQIYRETAMRAGARIAAVMDTHLHADHLSGAPALAAECAAPYFLSDRDAAGAALAHRTPPAHLDLGETRVDILTLPVPGHTLGSTALLVDGHYLMSGDTLLPQSLGRPDLGNKAREWTGYLYESLHGVLAKLDPATLVLPAHAAKAGQFDERGLCVRRLGALLGAARIDDREEFIEHTAAAAIAAVQPPEYARIRRVNLGEPVSQAYAEELEIGVNQCALASAGG